MPILRTILRTCILVAILVAIGAPGAHATPAEELAKANESFLDKNFDAAIGQFSALLYPTSRLADASEIAEAHLHLGVCYFETKQRESAAREFEEALLLNSELRLDATLYSVEAVTFFEAKREEIERDAEAAAESAQRTRKQQALDRALKNLVVLEKRRYWVNLMPFGLGQFQNGQRSKGIAFFTSQAATAGASIGLWSYQVVKYGNRGTVPRDEVSTVNTLQTVQIGAGAAFFALFAWGIVDSLSNYEHAVTRQADPSLIKELEDIYDIKPTSTVRVLPILSEDTGGMSVQWEF